MADDQPVKTISGLPGNESIGSGRAFAHGSTHGPEQSSPKTGGGNVSHSRRKQLLSVYLRRLFSWRLHFASSWYYFDERRPAHVLANPGTTLPDRSAATKATCDATQRPKQEWEEKTIIYANPASTQVTFTKPAFHSVLLAEAWRTMI
jgi:hypothetical protein